MPTRSPGARKQPSGKESIPLHKLGKHLLWLVAAMWIALASAPASALNLIRDAEIERTIRTMSVPIFQAAAITPSTVDIYLVNNRELNAFVVGGRNIFLHTGLLTTLDTPEEVIGVIAHETGHIAGGHEARRAINVRNARGPALAGMLAAILIGAAGGGEAGTAVAVGTQNALTRNLLSHSRGEEAAADQAALNYLVRAGVDPAGLLKVMERFRGQEVLSAGSIDPYLQTHPLSTQRLQLMEERAAQYAHREWPKDPEQIYWFRRMQAKLEGFLDNPERVLDRLAGHEETEITLYAKAVALHRIPDPKAALEAMDRLLALRPNDPFYIELKGQILYEIGRAQEAVPLYREAVRRAPNEPLLMAGLGRALLALETDEANREALTILQEARSADRGDATALRDLAMAYSRAGDDGMATLATAERYALVGRLEDAFIHARRAELMLPEGSPGWLRAHDILVLDKK